MKQNPFTFYLYDIPDHFVIPDGNHDVFIKSTRETRFALRILLKIINIPPYREGLNWEGQNWYLFQQHGCSTLNYGFPLNMYKTRPGNLVDATSPRWKLWEAKVR